MKTRLVHTLVNSLVVLVSIGVIIMILELASRLFVIPTGINENMDFFNLRTSSYYQKDETLGWLPRKNVHGVHNQSGSFSTTFQTNSRGLRDRDYPPTKSKNFRRIIVLGDSFTWGWGVGDQEIYTEVLESRLKNAEVINLGVTAFGIPQEFRYLQQEGMQYDPDIVLLALCLNDIETPATTTQNTEQTTKSQENQDENSFAKLKRYLSSHSSLFTFIMGRINANKSLVNWLVQVGVKGDLAGYEKLDINIRPMLKVYPEELHLAFEQTKSNLLHMKEFLYNRGVRFVVILIPSLQSVEDETAFAQSIAYLKFDTDDFDTEKPYRLLQEFGKENDIEVLSPLVSFKRTHQQKTKLFLNRDMHFNALGHELFAHEVYSYLLHGSDSLNPHDLN